jgi:hypothetical protein
MTTGIFISYRRSDSKSDARSICQRLEKSFGKRKIFIDVDSIRPGENFQTVLKRDLEKCNSMVVVIGPRWLELLKSFDRVESKKNLDYARLEVASALERKLPIFPVLVDGATMPEPKDLPDDLKPLAYRQAFSVRHDSFPRDMWELEQELRRFVSTRSIWKVVAISGILVILLCAIYYYLWRPPLTSAETYSKIGNYACFGGAEYPDSWRDEAASCVTYGCNFGKMPQDVCLALGARKESKIVIHGVPGTSRANECWLQNSCKDLREYGEFMLFQM